jgi:hypothetical protein
MLQSQFGDVRITNAGQARLATRVPDPARPGRFIEHATQRGEQYVTSCPFCGDDRSRLYVSYMYGALDPTTDQRNYALWCCHNEKCHQVEANRLMLRSRLAVPISRRHAQHVEIAPAPTQPSAPPEIIFPEGITPIAELPADHPAAIYLTERGFDLQYLQQTWDVSYCDWCIECRPPATRRIVIPVYRPALMFADTVGAQQLVLGGWQARIVPGHEPLAGSDAKYLSAAGMQKSELLYGLPQALAVDRPVYLVEGPTDAWRIGPGALALFGKDLSQTQKLLLVHHFEGRPIYVTLDQDARDAAVKIQRELSLARSGAGDNRVLIMNLPTGRKDPADCSPEEIAAFHVES